MKRNAFVIAALLSVVPSMASADNVGGCGVGSKLFSGQRGVAPQVLAILTNGTFFNTFGVTSGTSGCTQDGVVTSAWKTAAYVDGNMNRLAVDMSRGQGESLASLAALLGVKNEDMASFNVAMQKNFTTIFASPNTTSVDVTKAIKNILETDQSLAQYSINV